VGSKLLAKTLNPKAPKHPFDGLVSGYVSWLADIRVLRRHLHQNDINSLTAVNLTGTLQTASQTNITTVGILTSLSSSGGAIINKTNGTVSSPSNTDFASKSTLCLRNAGASIDCTTGISFIVASDENAVSPGAMIQFTRTNGSSVGDLMFCTKATNCDERMRITSAGNVGIGTSAPATKLNVSGGFQSIGTTITGNGTVLLLDNTTGGTGDRTSMVISHNTDFEFSVGGSTHATVPNGFYIYNQTYKMILNSAGRVGINTTSPEAFLHVGGAIWGNDVFHSKINNASCVYSWRNASTGNVGIGSYATTSPGSVRIGQCSQADFSWTAYLPVYGGAYTNASDERLKKDIVDVPYELAEVMLSKPRQFTWRDSQQRAIGFIAQEVMDIVPEPVHLPEDPDKLNDQGLPCNPLGVDYASLTSVLCRAIQEQQAQIDELKAIISALQ
jgi:hypothetical protein